MFLPLSGPGNILFSKSQKCNIPFIQGTSVNAEKVFVPMDQKEGRELSPQTQFLSVKSVQYHDLFALKMSYIQDVGIFDSDFQQKIKVFSHIGNFVEVLDYYLTSDEYYRVVSLTVSIILRQKSRFISTGDESSEDEDENIQEITGDVSRETSISIRKRETQLVEIAYSILRGALVTKNPNSEITKSLAIENVEEMFELFNHIGNQEKEFLKQTVHKIYGRIVVYREELRRMFKSYIEDFSVRKETYPEKKKNAMSVRCILEIFGTIVSGFKVPLKVEHVEMIDPLMELLRSRFLDVYFESLGFVLIEFCRKELDQIPKVIDRILNCVVSSKKDPQRVVLLLRLLEGVLEQCYNIGTFRKIHRKTFTVIARCLNDTNFNICQQALQIFQNDYVGNLFHSEFSELFPIVYEDLRELSKNHWNVSLRQLGGIILLDLIEKQPTIFKSTLRNNKNKSKARKKLLKQRDSTWEMFELEGQMKSDDESSENEDENSEKEEEMNSEKEEESTEKEMNLVQT